MQQRSQHQRLTRVGRRALIWVGTAVAALAIVGLVVGFVLFPVAPKTLSPSGAPGFVPVTSADYFDELPADLTVEPSRSPAISSPVSGRITNSSCAPGQDLTSGSTTWAVDGARVVNLATTVPLWRDLARGDQGEDVAAVQTELERLGIPLAVDGVLGRDTLNAFATLSGDPQADIISQSRVIWLPAPSQPVASCEHLLGDYVGTGDSLAKLTSSASIQIGVESKDLVDGDRVLDVDDQVIPLTDLHAVTDPLAIAQVLRTGQFQAGKPATDGKTRLKGILKLVKPVKVNVVPPSSIYRVEGDLGCVFFDRPIPVKIVGSQLGKTFVQQSGTAQLPDQVLAQPGRDAAKCR